MHSGIRFALTLAAVCLLASGCANFNSIYRNQVIGPKSEGSHVLLIDAKQRAILTAVHPVNTNNVDFVERYRAFCAEPSPDVFSVLSQAASASGDFGKDAATVKAAFQAAFSGSETGSTIPRTQTINMLREMMYRTCERYLSGALNYLQFPVQAVRDQHLMVSILAIEQLTGVVTPPVVKLLTQSSVTGQSSAEAIEKVADARNRLDAADAELKNKEDTLVALDKDSKQSARNCEDLDKDYNEDPAKLTVQGDKDKEAACRSAGEQIDAAKAAQSNAQIYYDSLTKLAGSGNGRVGTSASGQAEVANSPDAGDRAETVEGIAKVVSHIVDRNFDQDEFLLFCLRALDSQGSALSNVRGACLNYVKSSIDLGTAKLNRQVTEEKAQMQVNIDTHSAIKFDQFWAKVVSKDDPDKADVTKLQEVMKPAYKIYPSEKESLDAMLCALSKDRLKEIFDDFAAGLMDTLAE